VTENRSVGGSIPPLAPFQKSSANHSSRCCALAARPSTFLPFLTDLMTISAMSMRYR
jgi:hypothetical protein